MAKCFRQYDYVQYDGSNGEALVDAVTAHESIAGVTWSLVSDDGTTLVVNWHGDQDQPYEITLGQYVVFDGPQWSWAGPIDSAVFAARYATV